MAWNTGVIGPAASQRALIAKSQQKNPGAYWASAGVMLDFAISSQTLPGSLTRRRRVRE
jgi:hypothetical protein